MSVQSSSVYFEAVFTSCAVIITSEGRVKHYLKQVVLTARWRSRLQRQSSYKQCGRRSEDKQTEISIMAVWWPVCNIASFLPFPPLQIASSAKLSPLLSLHCQASLSSPLLPSLSLCLFLLMASLCRSVCLSISAPSHFLRLLFVCRELSHSLTLTLSTLCKHWICSTFFRHLDNVMF